MEVLSAGQARLVEALLDGPRTLTDLVKQTGLSKPVVHRYGKELSDAGFVRRIEERTHRGRQVSFAVLDATVHFEIREAPGIVLQWIALGKTWPDHPLVGQVADPGAREEVAKALTILGAALEGERWDETQAILFGSVARGEHTWKSDIDLLLVSDAADDARFRDDARDAIASMQQEFRHPPRLHFAKATSFTAGRHRLGPAVYDEGVMVYDGIGGNTQTWKTLRRYKRISR